MKRLVLAVCLVLALAFNAKADINFIGGGGSGGGGGGGATITTGTWTPGIAGSTGAGTAVYTNQIGNYIEFAVSGGQTWITVTFFITTSSFSGATGSLNITGLPVNPTQANNFYSGDIANTNGITLTANYTIIGTQTSPNNSFLSVIQSGSAQSAAFVPVSGAASVTQLIGSITYRVS